MNAAFFKRAGQLGHDRNHHKRADQAKAGNDKARINHGAADAGNQIIVFFHLIGQISQDFFQFSRSFAGTDDIDEQIGKRNVGRNNDG